MAEQGLTEFQVEVARLFFSLPESDGFLLAGGAALLASELTTRPTRDLDLFTHPPVESVAAARAALLAAIDRRAWTATIIHNSATFCRFVVHGYDELLVDLAVDSPPNSTPTMTVIGPSIAPLELAGRKLLALFGRAEARDFVDVFVLAQRFGKEALLEQASSVDPGFDERVLAQMMTTLGRFGDDEMQAAPRDIPQLQAFFAEWAAELDSPDTGAAR